ncbi:MAG TPA: bacterioferritin [Anaerolineaceae bacterium]|jgi:bacterioferritin|nr:bacterioferritin [Anaerolineaceae bacterium]HOD43637.1 bacterioferritin [Anaerolineaceae bacterium]HOU44983.1 bacterioferritin [Anaerolineaceae bacterium]HPA33638.1 bacterioferritin [Anaerolineaceae bacterium]HQF46386.1 bacterioferritin [Anaerolineaceae bacterium]
MKGNDRIIAFLNDLLKEELTAISQYMLHSVMCEDWGYEKLHDVIEHRAIEEMKHAEMLMERLLFLEGKPILSELNKLHVGDAVDVQFQFDHESEIGAVKLYNDGIRLAVEVGDNGTRELFETILKDEENHVDWLESQLDQIDQMGLPNYLTEQVG